MKLYEPFTLLTEEQCKEIIKWGIANGNLQQGTTNGHRKGKPTNPKVRNNRVVWYKDSKYWQTWIDILNSVSDRKIDWIQTPQISFYKPGEFYEWHEDGFVNPRTHVRHLTMCCELRTAPGGFLELQDKDIRLKQGQAVVFPVLHRHRAVSPSQQERISMVIWGMTLNPRFIDKK